MKRYLFALFLICAATLPACQCDNPPDMAPVEGETTALLMIAPEGLA